MVFDTLNVWNSIIGHIYLHWYCGLLKLRVWEFHPFTYMKSVGMVSRRDANKLVPDWNILENNFAKVNLVLDVVSNLNTGPI